MNKGRLQKQTKRNQRPRAWQSAGCHAFAALPFHDKSFLAATARVGSPGDGRVRQGNDKWVPSTTASGP